MIEKERKKEKKEWMNEYALLTAVAVKVHRSVLEVEPYPYIYLSVSSIKSTRQLTLQ